MKFLEGDGDWPPLIARFLATTILGGWVWVSFPPTENPVERMAAALIAGFGGTWLLWSAYRVARALLSKQSRR